MQETTNINGRYVTSELLGGGGMAQVFLARDEVLERDVAIKVLRGQYAEDEEFVERFRREALGVASLSHPNIVQVYDRGVSEDGRYYIAMEYVPGGTLKDRIVRNGPLSPDTASSVAVQIADALGAAHERGLIHRDVKPQNVLVTASGDVKVADFGIARAAAADVISRTSAVLGTARYMSPEQAMGQEVGPPSDLYSLGVVLYEMLTGEVPFEADTPVAVSMKHVNEPPRPPREIRGEIPEELDAVVLKLLAKDPGARYASAAALVADLDLVADGLAPVGQTGREAQTEPLRPASGGPVPGGRGTRRRLSRILIPLALLALMGAAGWGLLGTPNLGEIVGSLEGVTDRARAEAEEIDRAVSPSDVKVPDVEGLDEAAARKRLDEAGLGTAVRNRRSGEDAGQVIEQSVPPGKKVEEGSRILLAISSGPGPDGQQGSAPDPAPDDQAVNLDVAEGSGGSGDPPGSGDYGGSGSGESAASPEPAPSPTPDAGQEANDVPPAPSSPEPASREAPAPAPSSPAPSSPEPASPTPSSPEPSSPGPSSPEPSPEPSSPAPSSPAPASPEPESPAPSSPAPASPEPESPAPS
ncbi:MAG: protein kinase, partial [Rubrobacter sp.]